MRAIERPVPLRWLLTGAGLGAGGLLKSQFLLLLVAVIGLLAINGRLPARRRLGLAGLLVAGALAVMSPLIARNLAVGVGPLAPASSGAANFILANAEDAGAGDLGTGHAGHDSEAAEPGGEADRQDLRRIVCAAGGVTAASRARRRGRSREAPRSAAEHPALKSPLWGHCG